MTTPKDVLLVNDDGIHSLGFMILKKKIDHLGNITPVAPRKGESGRGKSISVDFVGIEETTLEDGTKGYAVCGTPATACLLALFKILKKTPDLVISGINLGPNLGIEDLFTSGTLGAALEAAIRKIPAIAVSCSLNRLSYSEEDLQKIVDMGSLTLCADLAERTAKFVLEHGMPKDVDLISINVPERLSPRTVEFTHLSYGAYNDIFAEKVGGYQIQEWTLKNYPNGSAGTDVHAVRERGHASITPIKLSFAHEKQNMKELSRFLIEQGYDCVL